MLVRLYIICDRSYIHINVELFLFLRAAVLFLRLEALKGKYHFKGKKHIKIFYMCCLNACYVQLITFFLVFFPINLIFKMHAYIIIKKRTTKKPNKDNTNGKWQHNMTALDRGSLLAI